MRTLPIAISLIALAGAGAAPAVVIDTGDGSGNTSAPSADLIWQHVGVLNGATAVHLQDHWVITANHVGPGDLVLDGVTYTEVVGSDVQLDNGDGSFADLRMFGVWPAPPLPPLPIAASTPPSLALLIMGGNGRNRGAATTQPTGCGFTPKSGYWWSAGKTLRWGTNFLELSTQRIPTSGGETEAFGSVFDADAPFFEAQAATGDSGGGVFAFDGSQWQLSGLIIAIGVVCQAQQPGQPLASTSLYTQKTLIADLAYYRDQMLDVMALPEPDGGLVSGVALLAGLKAVRSRRRAGLSSRI